MTNSLQKFCETAQRVAATTKRLEKAASLSEYFEPLDDENLALAVRFFAGQTFSQRDGRTVNIGGSAIMKALEAIAGTSGDELRTLLVQHGDFGDLAQEVLPNRESVLTLQMLADFFADLAATSGSKSKLEKLVTFLQGA